jgi:uncharacterized tellurite resistance protein B-like protein
MNICSLLNHEKCDPVRSSIAVLMVHIIKADGKITNKEINYMRKLFADEFGMKSSESDKLFNDIEQNIPDLEGAVEIINNHLRVDNAEKAKIMAHLNQLICIDGVEECEYDMFEQIRKIIM